MTSRAGYWIGAGLLAVGVLGAILWAVLGFSHLSGMVDDFERVEIPGTRTVHLDAHKLVIYVEGPGVDKSTPPVQLVVRDARSERELPISAYGGSLTYSFHTTGSAVATMTPPRDGDYVVRVPGVGAPGVYGLALGPSIGGRLVVAIVGALAIGGVFGLGGIGLLVTTGVRRSRRRAAAVRSGAAI